MIVILVWAARNADNSKGCRVFLWMAAIGYPLMTFYHFICLIVLGIPFTWMMASVIALHIAVLIA
jgi:hypothetical protein